MRSTRSTWSLPALVLLLALASPAAAGPAAPVLPVPPRPTHAPTASQFLARTAGLPQSERQRAAVAELEHGNLPRGLARLQPVHLAFTPPGGRRIQATVWVTPDYLALGRADDYVYFPLTRPSADEVARRLHCVLPTRRIVDAVYRQARVRLRPQPLPAGPRMRTNAYTARHQALIEAQEAGLAPGTFVSGHKKDLVLSNRLLTRPDRVAIYGWHRLDGRPIQPLSTVHGLGYADYSHGVRLVWHQVAIGGVLREIYEVLADPALAPVLSDEGPLREARAIMGVPGAAEAPGLAATGAALPAASVAGR